MPTTITKTVKPSGGDYTSLSAWEAGQQADLTVADQIQVAECYAMSDTTAITIDGWTTSATQYIQVTVPSTERHAGIYTTSKYRLEQSPAFAIIDIFEDHVRIDGVQTKMTASAAGTFGAIFSRSTTSTVFVSATICRGVLSGSALGFGIGANRGTMKVKNCLAYDFINGTTASAGFWSDFEANAYWHNNTAQNCQNGFLETSVGAHHARNNGAASCTTGFSGTLDTNVNNSSTAPTFVDAAGDDFHLASSDTTWKDAGSDLSGDANLAVTDDIDGQTRSGTWDIGADELVATSPPMFRGS